MEGVAQTSLAPGNDEHTSTPQSEPSRNPVLDDVPWFQHQSSFNVPLRVGEGADTAFATRFRQSISPVSVKHPPRFRYPSEAQIASLSAAGISTPTPTRARFLIQAALANIDKIHHIVQRSSVSTLLDRFFDVKTPLDILARCKVFALLALGELYTSHCRASDGNFPGLQYFSLASKAYGCLLERPSVDSIETALLLVSMNPLTVFIAADQSIKCLYSLCVNRWHSAYFLASSAIRHSAVMGLQFNLPEAHVTDRATREHLRRLWWTSYTLEHICAVNCGQMILIEDDEITVDFPSSEGLSKADHEDFEDPSCMCAIIELVRLMRKINSSLYGRRNHSEPFLQRVQAGLRGLKHWSQSLPGHLHMQPEPNKSAEHVKSLHLLFNQVWLLWMQHDPRF